MRDSYLLLTPVLVLGVLALIGFVGCEFFESFSKPPPPPRPFATVQVLGTLRPADFSGFLGMAVDIGSKSLKVQGLQRYCIVGSTGDHRVQIVDAETGTQVPSAAVIISLAGQPDGFAYGKLSSTITLTAGKRFFIVSEEVTGGDPFYDNDTVLKTEPVATVVSPVYFDSTAQQWVFMGSGSSYGPVNFAYDDP